VVAAAAGDFPVGCLVLPGLPITPEYTTFQARRVAACSGEIAGPGRSRSAACVGVVVPTHVVSLRRGICKLRYTRSVIPQGDL
jgi:hypothetical protein